MRLIVLLLFFVSQISNARNDTFFVKSKFEAGVGFNKDFLSSYTTNYGLGEFIIAHTQSTTSGKINTGRSFLSFDLPDIPANFKIIEATLSLYKYSKPITATYSGNEGFNSTFLNRIVSDWGEFTVNWNNQPAISSINQVVLPGSNSLHQDYLDIPVLELGKDMYTFKSESFGISIRLVNESSKNVIYFSSSEVFDDTKWPLLKIIIADKTATNSLVNPDQVKIGPNPLIGNLNISFLEDFAGVNYLVLLSNSLGATLISKNSLNVNFGQTSMDVSHLSSRFYYVEILDQSGVLVFSKTIIKQ